MIYRGIFAKGIFDFLNETYKFGGAAKWLLFAAFAIAVIAASYLMGSLNFAVIISKIKYGEDIRNFGSGNGGTTNMLRTYGKKTGALTLVCDMLKAVVSVTVGCLLMGLTVGGYIAAFFCMLGHMFPIYYKFKGGKGVAVVAASILMLNPIVFAILFLCFVVIVAGTKYVSLGSVMCVLLFPIFLETMNQSMVGYLDKIGVTRMGPDMIIAILIAVFVVFMHRENIKRLMAGTESKISFGKKNADGEKKEKK